MLMALFTEVVEISIFWLGYLMYHGLWHCKHIFCCLIFTDMIRAWQFSSTQKIAGRAWLQSLLSCLVLESLMRRWNKPWWTYGPLVLISLLWGSIYRLAQYLQQFPIESRHLLSLCPVINNGNYLMSTANRKTLNSKRICDSREIPVLEGVWRIGGFPLRCQWTIGKWCMFQLLSAVFPCIWQIINANRRP